MATVTLSPVVSRCRIKQGTSCKLVTVIETSWEIQVKKTASRFSSHHVEYQAPASASLFGYAWIYTKRLNFLADPMKLGTRLARIFSFNETFRVDAYGRGYSSHSYKYPLFLCFDGFQRRTCFTHF